MKLSSASKKWLGILVGGFLAFCVLVAAVSPSKSTSTKVQPTSVTPAVTNTAPAAPTPTAATGGPAEGATEEVAKREANGWTGNDILIARAAFETNAGLPGPVARCAALNLANTNTLEQVENFSAAERKAAGEQAVASCVQKSAQAAQEEGETE
jgi:hypothetical protein